MGVGDPAGAQLEDAECGRVPQDPPERGAVGTDLIGDLSERSRCVPDGVGDTEAGHGVQAPRAQVRGSRRIDECNRVSASHPTFPPVSGPAQAKVPALPPRFIAGSRWGCRTVASGESNPGGV